MDALEVGGSIPTIGGATILLVIIGVVTRLWLGAEGRHLAELTRVNKAHDDELTELRADITELRKRVDSLTQQVDTEREARWKAEDAAATARRQGGKPGAK
ncbi:MAG: hypothetical protein ACJ72N_19820 [Labedaea sp.]